MNKELEELLEADMVEPSESEWSNPIVMVTKSDGTYRMCLNFREADEVANNDAYLLPHMDTILSKLSAAKYITTVDLSQPGKKSFLLLESMIFRLYCKRAWTPSRLRQGSGYQGVSSAKDH